MNTKIIVIVLAFNVLAMLGAGGLIYYSHVKESQRMTMQDIVLLSSVTKGFSDKWKLLLVFAFMGLSYFAIAFRLQIRSEIFVFLVCIIVLYIWTGSFNIKTRLYSLPVAVILSANLHTGVAPFMIGLCFVLLMNEESLKLNKKILWMLLCVIGLFITPHTYKVMPVLYKHLFYYSNNIMQNPDHQPLSFTNHFNIRAFSLAGYAFIFICVMSCIGLINSSRLFLNKAVTSIFVIFLIYMSFNRIRSFPFAILFLSPLALEYCSKKIFLLKETYSQHDSKIFVTLAALFVMLFVIHLGFFNLQIGWGLDKSMYPIGSVDFIKKTRPLKNIYHGFAYGHYMDWNLKEYPVFVDTRETMFWKLQDKILAAHSSSGVTRELYRSYNINTALNPIPSTEYIQGSGFVDVIEQYNPSKDWALVYFDHISVLVVKRIKEHEHIYKDHEYVFLRPNLPPNNYIYSSIRNEANDKKYEEEINLCRKDEPENVFCVMAGSAWARTKDKNNILEIARHKDLLENIDNRLLRRADTIQYLVELMSVYKILGLNSRTSAIEEQLNSIGN